MERLFKDCILYLLELSLSNVSVTQQKSGRGLYYFFIMLYILMGFLHLHHHQEKTGLKTLSFTNASVINYFLSKLISKL